MKRVATIVVALSASTACTLNHESTGIDHRLQFSYTSGSCMIFRCDLSEALMLGTTETLEIDGTMPQVNVVSSDSTIVSVAHPSLMCCTTSGNSTSCNSAPQGACPSGTTASLSVEVTALGVGTARVHVVDLGGNEIDAADLNVEAPATLSLTCTISNSTTSNGTTTIGTSQTCSPQWTAHDANAKQLLATEGVVLTTSDVGVAALKAGPFGPPLASVEGNAGLLGTEVVGVASGDAVITATAAGTASASTKIHVGP